MTRRKIGLIGHGQIGSYVYRALADDDRFEVVFVHDANADSLRDLPNDLVLDRLEDFAQRGADLVCELAHADVAKRWGATILKESSFFVLSVTALGDAEIEKTLRATAGENRTTVFVPHGGVMGLDAILDGGDSWEQIEIEMVKHPRNLDFRASGIDGESITEPTVLYDGPTRGVCAMFPRNVNTHATLALAGVGMDNTHSRLIANPDDDSAIVAITARGSGVELVMRRSEQITGVTGATTPRSVLESIRRAASNGRDVVFC